MAKKEVKQAPAKAAKKAELLGELPPEEITEAADEITVPADGNSDAMPTEEAVLPKP